MDTRLKKKVTKSDSVMAFVELEDLYGSIEMIVFPKTLEQYVDIISVGKVVFVKGRISTKDSEIKLIPDTIELGNSELLQNLSENSKKSQGLHLTGTKQSKL